MYENSTFARPHPSLDAVQTANASPNIAVSRPKLRPIVTRIVAENMGRKRAHIGRIALEGRMANRTTTFVSAVFASFLACVALITAAGSYARAADDCITGPKGQAPQGSHWYYSLNRVTHRKCWYLGAEGLKVRQVASPKPSSSAMQTLQQRAEIPTLKSVADAHAEQLIDGPSAELPIVANPTAQRLPEATEDATAGVNSRGWALSSRWPNEPNSSGSTDREPGLTSNPDNHGHSRMDLQDEKPPVVTTTRLAAPEATVSSGRPLLALLAGALALVAIIGPMIFKYSAARRPGRRDIFDRGAARNANVPDERVPPTHSGSVVPTRPTSVVRDLPKSSDPSGEMKELPLFLRSLRRGAT